MNEVVSFVLELERLKSVTRKTRVVGSDRFENSAEHSWQIALLATSLWHLIASRNTYRAVTQPLVQLLALWALFATTLNVSLRWLREWPALGALFMSLSTIIVAINAQTLRRAKLLDHIVASEI